MPLPNFFLLGAAKAGTTGLYRWLSAQHEVYMSFVKEPMFFSRDDYYRKGLAWYAKTFFPGAGTSALRGEASPHYLYWAAKVAPRIYQALGGQIPKFIVVLRDPVARAYSWYWNMVRDGVEPLSFSEALAQESIRLAQQARSFTELGSMQFGYQRGGMYASHLKEFLNFFPRDNFLFFLQEDLRDQPQRSRQAICDFLHITATAFDLPAAKQNPASIPRSRTLQAWLRKPSAAKDLVKVFLPFNVRHRLKVFLLEGNARPFDYPPLEKDTEAALRGYFAREIKDLEALIQRDLSHWLPARPGFLKPPP